MISAVVVVVVVVIKSAVIEMLLSLSSNNCMGTEGDHKMPHKEEVFNQLYLLSLQSVVLTVSHCFRNYQGWDAHCPSWDNKYFQHATVSGWGLG